MTQSILLWELMSPPISANLRNMKICGLEKEEHFSFSDLRHPHAALPI